MPIVYWITGFAIVAIVALGLLFARGNTRGEFRRSPPDPGPPLSAELQAEVRELLGRNAKIEAIKRVRAATGRDLKQAKDAVEALER